MSAQSLIKLGQEVQRSAATLEAELQKNNYPHPTFEEDGPSSYPPAITHPELQLARKNLLTACTTLTDLALGPIDRLKLIVGPELYRSGVLKVIDYHRIDQLVPKHGSISYDELSSTLGIYPGILKRTLRYAMAFHFFVETTNGEGISHTSLSRAFPNIQPWVRLLTSSQNWDSVQKFVDSLRIYNEPAQEGNAEKQIPFAIAHDGKPFFEVLRASTDPRFTMEMFSAAMKAFASNTADLTDEFYVRAFDWAALGEGPVIDVGGGNGYVSVALAKAFPKLHFIVQDLPQIEKSANETIPDDLKDRVKFMAHDFFTPQPKDIQPKAYFMKSVLHDWSDEDCARILKNMVREFEKGVRLFDIDRIMPRSGERPAYEEAFMRYTDLLMFSMLGAKERDLDMWESLCSMVDERLKVKSWKTPQGSEWGMLEFGF